MEKENERTFESCSICNRPWYLLPAEFNTGKRVFHHVRHCDDGGYYDQGKLELHECSDCYNIPCLGDELAVIHNQDVILLWHNLDNDTWSTATYKDTRFEGLLDCVDFPEDVEIYYVRTLQPFEVEKIKSAPGRLIIIWPEKFCSDGRLGRNSLVVGPPEVYKNSPE